ncbi:radical SAM family heme chaperone HemW [Alphaproteobacteria bacterium LSUCC0684]
MGIAARPFGLYIHWPFCRAKCPYCDFNSHVREAVDHDRWKTNLLREMETLAEMTACKGRVLDSIFIGGGTPSLMEPSTVAALLDRAGQIFAASPDIEITMEANPTSVEAGKMAAFAGAGVSRISLGVQALDDAALVGLGREHSGAEALKALEHARRNFQRVSADFIYARPDQTLRSWTDELDRILNLGLDHLSLYQLTLEPGTAFWSQHQRGLFFLPEDELARNLYDLTQEKTAAAGLPAYEISNHARPGQESRHNLLYWQAGDWIGTGPGAYGRVWRDGLRIETRSRRDPSSWLDDVEAHGHALDQESQELPADYGREAMMMGLRLTTGVDLDAITSLAGPRETWINTGMLEQLVASGHLDLNGERLRLKEDARPLLNSVLTSLVI